jgi:subtilisin family serine protease
MGGRQVRRWFVAVVGMAAALLPGVEPAAAALPAGSSWPADAVPGALLVSTSDGSTEVVRVAPGTESSAAENIRQRAGVLAVEPDRVRQAFAAPGDARYAEQWAHTVARAPAGWDITTGTADVRVAVIDTGIDATHPDLAANVVAQAETSSGVAKLVPTGTNNDPCDDRHGTSVAGVLGAVGGNGIGISGIAWRVSIVDVAASDRARCSGGFSDSATLAAIRWAADPAGGNADVINLSLGGPGDICPFAFKGALDYAQSQGAVVVAASGNSQLELPGVANIPASCAGVISVGAVGLSGTYAPYSTANAYVDVVAPGGDTDSGGRILSTVPGGGYELTEGTSFSAPYIAGTIALLKAVRPALTIDEAERVIQGTTQGAPATRSNLLGWGLVDVGAAVQAASTGAIPAARANASLPSAAVLRISAAASVTQPILQAVTVSQYVFPDDRAEHVVLTRPDQFADGLGGSSLAYGVGPVLFTPSTGSLEPATEAEIDRVLPTGGRVYVLGGTFAVPTAVDDRLRSLGYDVVRLGGTTRYDTARLVAAETLRRVAELGFEVPTRALVVTGHNWPDAVVAGNIGALYGDPIVLAEPNGLGNAGAQALQQMRPAEVVVVGGPGVVSDLTKDQASFFAGAPARRVAGPDRAATAVAVARELEARLAGDFGVSIVRVVAVNLRQSDAFAHVLSATALVGSVPGIFLPIEGDGGTVVPSSAALYACTLDPFYGIAAGGTDLIADATKQELEQLLTHASC